MSGRRNESMQIGQISKRAGISIDAIRFYERSGLLAAPARSDGGFRLYSLGHLSTLQFIRNLQALEVIHVRVVAIKSFHRGTKIFDARMNIRIFLSDIADVHILARTRH